jgi:Vitamin K-dependent gamma-carboxylase
VHAAGTLFALLLAYVALADRLEAFTVSKIAPALVLALVYGPASARYSVDAWRTRRRAPDAPLPTTDESGALRFFQVFLVVMYSGSGIAKLRGDWLDADVLWSHLHDDYQTAVAYLLLRALPAAAWRVLQWLTLAFEVGAPLWFALPWTRTPALVAGLGMHAMIGLMFGPVVWFALLMSSLLVACFAPESVCGRLGSAK